MTMMMNNRQRRTEREREREKEEEESKHAITFIKPFSACEISVFSFFLSFVFICCLSLFCSSLSSILLYKRLHFFFLQLDIRQRFGSELLWFFKYHLSMFFSFCDKKTHLFSPICQLKEEGKKERSDLITSVVFLQFIFVKRSLSSLSSFISLLYKQVRIRER